MVNYVLRKISSLPPIQGVIPYNNGFLPVEQTSDGLTYSLSLNSFRLDLLNSPILTGEPTLATVPPQSENTNRLVSASWVNEKLAGLGLNPASAASFGTVRLFQEEANPIVYSAGTVDQLLAQIRPVALGGTGAVTPSQARVNLVAAQSGANGDITSLNALTSVPGVITNAITNEVRSRVPAGTILPFAGTVIPSGYFLCAGQSVNRTTYPELFAAIGTTYGAGNGTTTFNLPNLQGRFPMGSGTAQSGGSRSVGNTGGTDTHTLTTSEIPVHSHNITDDGTHNHNFIYNIRSNGAGSSAFVMVGIDGNPASGEQTRTATTSNGGTHDHGGVTGVTGSGNPHNNLPPFLVVNFIIAF